MNRRNPRGGILATATIAIVGAATACTSLGRTGPTAATVPPARVASTPATGTATADPGSAFDGLHLVRRLRVPLDHRPFDVVSNGREVVWDAPDSPATAVQGGRRLYWQPLSSNTAVEVSSAPGTDGNISDAVPVDDMTVFWRDEVPSSAPCGTEPGTCFTWSLWRRQMPSGRAVRLAGSDQSTSVAKMPVLIPVGGEGVVYQQPKRHSVAAMYCAIRGAPRELMADVTPGTIGADDGDAFAGRTVHRDLDLLRIDISGQRQRTPVTRLMNYGDVRYLATWRNETAAVLGKRDPLRLTLDRAGRQHTHNLPGDVYGMFWINADHLLLYTDTALAVFDTRRLQLLTWVPEASVDVGASVDTDNGALAFAIRSTSFTDIFVFR